MSKELETIFAYAVALDQSGRLKNTIHCKDNRVFVLNNDSTVILNFTLSNRVPPFKHPISFKADDYDSANFVEKDGSIVFIQQGEEFTRKKTCGAPGLLFHDVENLWGKMVIDFPLNDRGAGTFSINKKSLALIEENLSHLELYGKAGKLIITQRDVFSGTIIRLTRKQEGLGAFKPDNLPFDFGPIGIRTSDFIALYSFVDQIVFFICPETKGVLGITGLTQNMSGYISICIYDELGNVEYLKEIEDGGRQKSENRGSEPQSDPAVESGKPKRKAVQ